MRASEVVRAPAKLNLTLEVLNRRSDGLHALRSVMVPLDLCDELRVAEDASFAFSCDAAELREDNLAARAFEALPLANRGFRIDLKKRIPTGAGMGGGSSDAAAVLLAAQRGVFGSPPAIDYVACARSLGSDVPFFLVETAALVEGTGERVTALGPLPQWHAVIVKPPVSVSTAWAYERIDAASKPSRPRSTSVTLAMAEALQRAQFDRAVELMQNDFHDALVPEIQEIRTAAQMLEEAGARRAMLTGSGSCVFGLFEDARSADAALQAIAPRTGYATYAAPFRHGGAWRSAA